MPRVSVIVATYNWSRVLPYSLGSVLRQTFDDFELLVVGDGCDDDSADVVAALGDPRIRWTNLPHNSRHQSAPNNEGLRQARGDLIAYLGHDDLWLPRHLELMVRALDDSGAGLAHSIAANIDVDGRPPFATLPDPSVGSFASPLAIVHRKAATDAHGGWRDHRDTAQPPDVELWRRLRAAGVPFHAVPRLTALKLPARLRRDVYRERPCAEQAAWSARLQAEPDLEATLLAQLLLAQRPESSMVSWRQEVRHFARRMWTRLRARLRRGVAAPAGADVEQARRFKGLQE